MVLDDLDRRLLELLGEDARRSYRTLASLAGSTVPTVSARIARMQDFGVIKGYTVVLDEVQFGDVRTRAAALVRVPCHECQQPTAEPIEASLGSRRHAFCCPTCKSAFTARYDRMRQA